MAGRINTREESLVIEMRAEQASILLPPARAGIFLKNKANKAVRTI
jgi:hypothetical protein